MGSASVLITYKLLGKIKGNGHAPVKPVQTPEPRECPSPDCKEEIMKAVGQDHDVLLKIKGVVEGIDKQTDEQWQDIKKTSKVVHNIQGALARNGLVFQEND